MISDGWVPADVVFGINRDLRDRGLALNPLADNTSLDFGIEEELRARELNRFAAMITARLENVSRWRFITRWQLNGMLKFVRETDLPYGTIYSITMRMKRDAFNSEKQK